MERARRHTGLTDVPLTEQGRREAVAVGARLSLRRFALVLTQPGRARDRDLPPGGLRSRGPGT
jgi:probable phosphoglycerate mutase